MFETIRNALKIKDVRNKILWTVLFVVIYRLGCYITVPGLQAINIEDGTTSIMDLGPKVSEKFEDAETMLYERLAKYVQILESYGFVKTQR